MTTDHKLAFALTLVYELFLLRQGEGAKEGGRGDGLNVIASITDSILHGKQF